MRPTVPVPSRVMRLPPCASAPLPALGMLFACGLLAVLAFAPTAGAAPSLRVVRDVRVPTIDGSSITVDLWRTRPRRIARAARPRLRPVALLVHGGGWHSGDKRQWEQSRWAQRLAQRGWLVVNANYRLACTADVPAREARERDSRLCGHAMRTSIADVRTTLRYTARMARSWGGDQHRIVLFGASAGGQLAMLAGSEVHRPVGVRAVVAIAPPTDLSWVGARPDLPLYASVSQSIGCSMIDCPDAWSTASPIANIRRGSTPPTWVFNAGADPITPIEPVRSYVGQLQAAGIPASLLTTADPSAACHGAIPCSGLALAGTRLDMFEHALAWLAPRIR